MWMGCGVDEKSHIWDEKSHIWDLFFPYMAPYMGPYMGAHIWEKRRPHPISISISWTGTHTYPYPYIGHIWAYIKDDIYGFTSLIKLIHALDIEYKVDIYNFFIVSTFFCTTDQSWLLVVCQLIAAQSTQDFQPMNSTTQLRQLLLIFTRTSTFSIIKISEYRKQS